MTKHYLNFDELSEVEKDIYTSDTWCDRCNKPDLGINEPAIYLENGNKFIEGKCVVCGQMQKTQIITKQVDV
jgi:hypothetical protein